MSLEPEDLLSESLVTIFEDVSVSLGEPGESLTHKTNRFGDIRLKLVKTDTDAELHKFAHHLWVSELQLAAEIDAGTLPLAGRHVLELGAAAGLCGILAVKADAAHVVLSDYPGPRILENLQHNVDINLTEAQNAHASVIGHTWGDAVESLLAPGGKFDIILLADCLWMPEQHQSLINTLMDVLKKDDNATIYCTAGFHTGRKKLAGFFDCVREAGLSVKSIHERHHTGSTRDWDPKRADCEDAVQRKRWIVVAELGWPRS